MENKMNIEVNVALRKNQQPLEVKKTWWKEKEKGRIFMCFRRQCDL